MVGRTIGSYRIIGPVGSGGMSTVFRAVHPQTGHEVALKVLLGSLSRNSTLLQRFLREARSAETLEHPNVVTIYDRGVDRGRHYLVLEYVRGGDFHEYIQRNGPLGAAEALTVIRGVADGLRHAAARGLIHRDIKPSNILRKPTGEPKIIDLGLALQSQFEDERVTREGTTVGTVDYMSPEQARDSRATSIHSDMYSLGCTFYYLLAGVPPYPGGDITEKLTRHARAPAPDIRDLRPDIPPAVAGILLRLMAKRPEDRYPDYDALIAALDEARPGITEDGGAVALMPLEDDEKESLPWPPQEVGARGKAPSVDWPPAPDDADPLPVESLGEMSLELTDERDPGERWAEEDKAAPLPRSGRMGAKDDSAELTESDLAGEPLAPPSRRRMVAWALATAGVATLAVVLVIGLHLTLGRPGASDGAIEEAPDVDQVADLPIGAPSPRRRPGPARGPTGGPGQGTKAPAGITKPRPAPPPKWEEPEDKDPIPGDPGPLQAVTADLRRELPEWTQVSNPTRPDDPTVVVRRFPDETDGPLTERTLHAALDRYQGGVVELADAGPFLVDDLSMSGESRTIRARRGYRPIIRILRSRNEAALERTAFVALGRKNLTVEGIDLIVEASELSGHQKALFGCAGGNLTLRDCTITVLNPKGLRFALVSQEPTKPQPKDPGPRPSRIWLKRALVRGSAFTLAELGGGPTDLVLDGTTILLGGAKPAPVISVKSGDAEWEQRVFLSGVLLACPGPVIACDLPKGTTGGGKPLAFRAYGSALGRLQGPGIASIVTATDGDAEAGRLIAWAGDRNLYAGWRGFFARGDQPTLTVNGLEQARSTWNAAEQGSREEPFTAWLLTVDPSQALPLVLRPFLSSAHASLMDSSPRPSAGLFAKTIDGYPGPIVPEVAAWAISRPDPSAGSGPRSNPLTYGDAVRSGLVGNVAAAPGGRPESKAPELKPAAGDSAEQVLSTSDRTWDGDLGAFLRRNLRPGSRHVRVRVVGTGSHRFTPVRLPDGIILEVRVESPPGTVTEPPSWRPDPQATGPGLIELRGGALVLSNVILRHDPASRLESLLALEDAHLVLSRCQLTVPADSGAQAGDLIAFRAPTTRSMLDHPGNAIFRVPIDRPVCRLIDSILIANRAALRADVGRGLIALTNCAIAADESGLDLDPAQVARPRFEADLSLEHCTIVAARTIVGLGPWRGLPAGPDRPLLVDSKRSAFVTMSADARTREAALLRVDAEAFAGGGLFWQSEGDAFDVDRGVAVGEAPTEPPGPREARARWEQFWGSNRLVRPAAVPRGPSFRFRERPRPGRIEPPDLILDPQRPPLEVGADLIKLGIAPRPARPAPRRN
jgi:serine/threonine-protein kinase